MFRRERDRGGKTVVQSPKTSTLSNRRKASGRLTFPATTSKTPVIASNNVINKNTQRQQLVNTYLTFTYEMRDNLPRRIFWRYVILMLLSIDKIAGVSSNDEKYSQLFEQTNSLNGTVPIDIQNTWARKFEYIVKNAKGISSSTTKSLNSMLKF
jgi:hypothetical protein